MSPRPMAPPSPPSPPTQTPTKAVPPPPPDVQPPPPPTSSSPPPPPDSSSPPPPPDSSSPSPPADSSSPPPPPNSSSRPPPPNSSSRPPPPNSASPPPPSNSSSPPPPPSSGPPSPHSPANPPPPPPPSTNTQYGSPPPPSPTSRTFSPPPPPPPKYTPNPPPPPKPPESHPSPISGEPPKKSSSSPPPPPPPPPSPPPPPPSPPPPPPLPPPSASYSPPSPSPPNQTTSLSGSIPSPYSPPMTSPPPPPPSPPPSASYSPPSPSPPNQTTSLSGSIPSPYSPPMTSPPPPSPPEAQHSSPPLIGTQASSSLPSRSPTPPDAPTTHKAPGSSSSINTRAISSGEAVGIGLVLCFALIGVISVAWWLWKRRRSVTGTKASSVMPTSNGSPKSDSSLLKFQDSVANAKSIFVHNIGSFSSKHGGLRYSKSSFTYEELAEASNGFSAENVLGEGGFGKVYKGRLSDGREVAIKQLRVGGGQGEREFRAEVEIISRIHHRHLVSLVGYCICNDRRLLIYDYVPHDTLHFHLHGEGRSVLDWATRVKIAIGAARGIAYLHEDCHPRIIHRDIKSSNILLGDNFEAQVSDFGLARLCGDDDTHVSTRVVGTFGYMAPEYASTGKLTEKSDVFSFGVVLLELITGRKPVDSSLPYGEESLVEWARPLLSRALETEEYGALEDPRLEKNYFDSQMCQMIEAASACIRHSAAKRPRMTLIVRAFDGMSNMDLSNGMRVGESVMYNPEQHSADIRLLKLMAFGSQDMCSDFFTQNSRSSELC